MGERLTHRSKEEGFEEVTAWLQEKGESIDIGKPVENKR